MFVSVSNHNPSTSWPKTEPAPASDEGSKREDKASLTRPLNIDLLSKMTAAERQPANVHVQNRLKDLDPADGLKNPTPGKVARPQALNSRVFEHFRGRRGGFGLPLWTPCLTEHALRRLGTAKYQAPARERQDSAEELPFSGSWV